MKTFMKVSLLALVASAAVLALQAQDAPRRDRQDGPPPGNRGPRDGGPRDGEGMPPRMIPPLMGALDLNRDGILDEKEIASASTSLMKLDKNGDGRITPEELRPRPPEGGPDGPFRPQGEGRPRGPRPDGERPGRPQPPQDQ